MVPAGGRNTPDRIAGQGQLFRLPFLRLLRALVVLSFLSPVALAAPPAPLQGDISETRLAEFETSLKERSAALDERIGAYRREEASSPATDYGVAPEDVKSYEYMLTTVGNVYSRSISAVGRIRELSRRRGESRLASLPPISRPAPYPLSYLDEHLERLDDLDEQLRENEFQQDQIREGLKEDAESLDTVRRKIRRATDRLGDATGGSSARKKAEWTLRFLRTEEETIETSTEFYRIRSVVSELARAILDEERGRLRERVAAIRKGLACDEEDLRGQIDRIGERSSRFLESAEWYASLLAATQGESGLRETIRKLEDQARQAAGLLNAVRETWERRYAILRPTPPETAVLDEWAGEAKWWGDVVRARLTDRQRFLANVAAYAASPEGSHPSRLPVLERGKGETLKYISVLLSFSRLQRRLLDEIGRLRDIAGIGERLKASVERRISDLGDIELWATGDVPVTLGKLLEALLILLVGIPAGNAIIRFVKKRLYRRQRQDIHVASLLLRLAQYVFVTILAVFALHAVRIPLTAFAFLGGAIVVGVGLGAQEFFRNLISGLALMIEKPVRIHDIIEIDNDVAVVKEIDSRTTHVLTFNGVDVFLPNSFFWENRIVNRTFSSKAVKLRLTIGIAYGAPVREVERLLLEVAAIHPSVLRSPAPSVTFADFAEHSLTFRLSFYLSQHDLLLSWSLFHDTMSELRFAITERLTEAGIEIVPTHRVEWTRRSGSGRKLPGSPADGTNLL
jgi:potassium efflux system protein